MSVSSCHSGTTATTGERGEGKLPPPATREWSGNVVPSTLDPVDESLPSDRFTPAFDDEAA